MTKSSTPDDPGPRGEMAPVELLPPQQAWGRRWIFLGVVFVMIYAYKVHWSIAPALRDHAIGTTIPGNTMVSVTNNTGTDLASDISSPKV